MKISGILNMIFITLFSIGIIGYAVMRVSDTYVTTGNLTLNDTGIYTNGSKSFVRTYDVVVCRNNTPEEYNKLATECDVVCINITDCGDTINQKFISGKSYIFRYDNYPLIKALQIPSNVVIDFSNSILNATRTSNSTIFIYNSTNVNLKNFRLYLNITTNSNLVSGIRIRNSSNVYLSNFEINNAEDQGIDVVDNSTNINILNGIINGTGRNGIMLGFDLSKIYIQNINMSNILGSTAEGYGIMVGDGNTEDLTIRDVYINYPTLLGIGIGGLKKGTIDNVWIFGNGTVPDTGIKIWTAEDLKITNSNIYNVGQGITIMENPIVGSNGVDFASYNKTNNVVIDKVLINRTGSGYGINSGYNNSGINTMSGNNIYIQNCIIAYSAKDSIFSSTNNTFIKNNHIFDSNWTAIYITGNSSSQLVRGTIEIDGNFILNANLANIGSPAIYLKNTALYYVKNNIVNDDGLTGHARTYNCLTANSYVSSGYAVNNEFNYCTSFANSVNLDTYTYSDTFNYGTTLPTCSDSTNSFGRIAKNTTGMFYCNGTVGTWRLLG